MPETDLLREVCRLSVAFLVGLYITSPAWSQVAPPISLALLPATSSESDDASSQAGLLERIQQLEKNQAELVELLQEQDEWCIIKMLLCRRFVLT